MKDLTKELWDICLGITRYQETPLLVIKNFGELSIWIVDFFSPKGIGQNYNEVQGRDVTAYLTNQNFYAPSGKTILEQAQGVQRVTLKFGHDDYIYIVDVS